MAFAPCPSCRRHVRVGASSCPFCGVLDPELTPKAAQTRRLPRWAMFAFSVAVAGCGGSVETPQTTDGGSDSATDTRVVDTAIEDEGSPVNLYGAPADTGGEDMGGGTPIYGAAPDR